MWPWAPPSPKKTTVAPAHGRNKGKTSKCASTFTGCIGCRTIDGTYTCTRCRANSAFDGSECACNTDEDFGTLSRAEYNGWVAEKCNNSNTRSKGGKKPKCKVPSYSSIQGRCVKCSVYGCTSQDGVCLRSAPPSLTSGRRLFEVDEDVWA